MKTDKGSEQASARRRASSDDRVPDFRPGSFVFAPEQVLVAKRLDAEVGGPQDMNLRPGVGHARQEFLRRPKTSFHSTPPQWYRHHCPANNVVFVYFSVR